MEPDNGLLLPILQPEIAGNPAVVLVHFAVAFPPVVELAGGDVEPLDEPPGADLGPLRPAPDEIYDLVPRIVRNPDPGQSSPSVFFRATCSAISSARTSSLVWIFSVGDPLLVGGVVRPRFLLEGGRSVLEELFLPAVEDRGLQAEFIAELRDGLLLQQMPPEGGDFQIG